jgi:hypothetical protein
MNPIARQRKSNATPPANAIIGIAGVHYVVSELSRRNLIALPTTRNVAGYDVIVLTPDGTKHANIQVKTSLRYNTFMMPSSRNIRRGSQNYYVLLRWLDKENRWDAFMLSGQTAFIEVRRWERNTRWKIYHKTSTVVVPKIAFGKKNEKLANRFRRKWDTWTL